MSLFKEINYFRHSEMQCFVLTFSSFYVHVHSLMLFPVFLGKMGSGSEMGIN